MRIITMKFISAICFSILAFAAATANAQVCQPAPVNLVSWYSGDGNALDSRSRNNATLLNGATFAAGESGQAFSFNGTSSFVQINNDSVLDFGTGDFSVELWFNLNTTSGDQTLFQKRLGNFPNTQEYLLESNNGNLRFLVRDTTANENNLEVAGMITPNTWNHFAAVRQGNNSKIYFNGNLVGNQTTGTNINTGTGGTAVFGKLLDFDLRFFNGRIDEAALYNRALSATEIAAITNAGTAGKCKPTATVAPTGLVGWWAGDGNANDIAGTNNGTLQNGAGFAIGKAGQSFSFDGINDFVSVSNALYNPFPASGFTYEFWLNAFDTPVGRSRTIVSNHHASGNWWNGINLFDGRVSLTLQNPIGNMTFGWTTTASITPNAYHHVVVAYQNTGAQTASTRIYIDGVLQTMTVGSNGAVYDGAFAPGYNAADSLGFNIGRLLEDTPNAVFNGKIDELSLYNRALTSAEITSIFNAGLAGKLKTAVTPTGFSVLPETSAGSLISLIQNIEPTENIWSNVSVLTNNSQPAANDDDSKSASEAVSTIIGDATVTFPNVATAGTTQVIPLDKNLFPALPSGTHTGLIYDAATSAAFTGSPTVCFNLPAFTAAQFAGLQIVHLENNF